MYAYTLKDFLNRKVCSKNFVTSVDDLPATFSLPLVMVVNLAPAEQPGTHWVAIFINRHRRGIYMDSYGFEPKDQRLRDFLDHQCIEWMYNRQQLQQTQSKVCGLYVATFLYYMYNNISLHAFMSQFNLNITINDFFVEKLFRNLNA